MTAVAYRWSPPAEERVDAGPWRGLLDSLTPTASRPDYLYVASNVWVRNLELGGTVVYGRPGLSLMGAQIGTGGARVPQRTYQFNQKGGTARTVAICGGRLFTYDWAGAWTERINTTDLSAASITLSTTARVYCVTFNDKMIVSDGINTPFAWDGTTNGGLTKMTNAPVFYGQPWVYANQLFGIKNADRLTIVWSEVAAENTGYEAGGYNNAWTVFQTSQDVLVAGAALNDAFILFRPFSCTAISGAVSSEFRSTHTREALSETVGTSSPGAVWVEDNTAYFIGTDKRFYRARQGAGEPSQVGVGAIDTLKGMSLSAITDAVVAPWTLGRSIIFGVRESGASAPDTFFVLDTISGDCSGVWRGWMGLTLDEVTNSATSEPTLVHGGGTTATEHNTGYFYQHGNPDGTLWSDAFQAATRPIAHEIGWYVGYDTKMVKRFDRLDLRFLLDSEMSTMQVAWQTPGMAGTTQTVSITPIGGYYYDATASVYDTATYAGGAAERRVAVGLKAEGRGLLMRVLHNAGTEKFAAIAATVTAYPLDQRPRTH